MVKAGLNILVLHALGDVANAPAFLVHHIFNLKNYCPENKYIYHDISLSLPEYVRDVVFDVIILDVTFLSKRWAPVDVFQQIKADYEFVKYSESVKVAFPQDEYDCNQLLDEWLCDWRVDVVFSVISSNWDVLYPRYHKVGVIKLGYTGYVDEGLIKKSCVPFSSRSVDVGYRAARLLPYFGRIGENKWTIGRDFARYALEEKLVIDIVLGKHGTLNGSSWLDFINNCKFTLGANSGSSLLDPVGHIQRRVRAYCSSFPAAEFAEVEECCFKGLDGKYAFTAISPRVMEAAILNSCQILVEGEYSGIVVPWEHYIPIKHDASNFSEVFDAMQDQELVCRLIRNCREAILDAKYLRCSKRAETVFETIADGSAQKNVYSNTEAVIKVLRRYEAEMPRKYATHWRRIAGRNALIKWVDGYPVISRALRFTQAKLKKFIQI
jgi:hypothetical protein